MGYTVIRIIRVVESSQGRCPDLLLLPRLSLIIIGSLCCCTTVVNHYLHGICSVIHIVVGEVSVQIWIICCAVIKVIHADSRSECNCVTTIHVYNGETVLHPVALREQVRHESMIRRRIDGIAR